MRNKEKRDFIDEKLTAEKISDADLDMLAMLSKDNNEYIRSETAIILNCSDSPRAESILLGMLNDRSADVRSSACRSLCTGRSADTANALKDCAVSDDDLLVRGYSVLGIIEITARLGIVSDTLIDFLENGLQNEKEDWVMAAYHFALYIAGKEDHLPFIIKGLDNEDYHIRCMSANLLFEAANRENAGKIIKALSERLNTEGTVAVMSTIDNALKELNDIGL